MAENLEPGTQTAEAEVGLSLPVPLRQWGKGAGWRGVEWNEAPRLLLRQMGNGKRNLVFRVEMF